MLENIGKEGKGPWLKCTKMHARRRRQEEEHRQEGGYTRTPKEKGKVTHGDGGPVPPGSSVGDNLQGLEDRPTTNDAAEDGGAGAEVQAEEL